MRGRSAFLTGHPVEGTRALVERERYLSDPAALRANRDELFAPIRTRRRARRTAEGAAEDRSRRRRLAGIRTGRRGDRRAIRRARRAALENWKRHFRSIPPTTACSPRRRPQIAAATEFPDQIALLLPLSGRAEAVGVAVRDGFIAAYLQQDAATPAAPEDLRRGGRIGGRRLQPRHRGRRRLRGGPAHQGGRGGRRAHDGGRTPVLALEFSRRVGERRPRISISSRCCRKTRRAWSARRVVADGQLNGVAIVPTANWGNRVAAAFADELSQHWAATCSTAGRYDPRAGGFLRHHQASPAGKATKVEKGETEPPTHRTDAASSSWRRRGRRPARSCRSSNSTTPATCRCTPPRTASSRIRARTRDIDGMYFPDMPWMVSDDPVDRADPRQPCTPRGRPARRGATACTPSDSTRIGWCQVCGRTNQRLRATSPA